MLGRIIEAVFLVFFFFSGLFMALLIDLAGEYSVLTANKMDDMQPQVGSDALTAAVRTQPL